MRRVVVGFVLVFGILGLFGGCGKNESSSARSIQKPKRFVLEIVDQKQPKKLVILQKGDGFVLEGREDRALLFDIYATWCPPCRAEAAVLGDIQKRFGKALLVIGLTIEEGIEDAKLLNYRKLYGADYALASAKTAAPLIDAIAKQQGIGRRFALPYMVLYHKGKSINDYVGAVEEEFILSDIKEALGR